MIKGIIFDLDNTLMDFGRLKSQAVNAAIVSMQEAGLDIDVQASFDNIMAIYKEKGWEFQQVFDQFITQKTGYLDYKYLAAAIVGYRRARESALSPYPYVNDTLIRLLRQGLKLGVVSDAPSREAWLRLFQLNFHHLFDAVVTFDDTRQRKPHPEPFLKALEKLQLEASEVMMVGDWPERDMIGAESLGITTIFAKYGDIWDTKQSGADFEIDRFDEICKIVEKINTGRCGQ